MSLLEIASDYKLKISNFKFMKVRLPKSLRFKHNYFTQPLGIAVLVSLGFFTGYLAGAGEVSKISKLRETQILQDFQNTLASLTQPTPTPTQKPNAPVTQRPSATISYTGPQLWEVVNKARVEHGVNQLSQRDILCTIAAIRLSQIRELGKLDGHDGFQGVYDKYKDNPNMPNNVAEFLISGYPTPDQAVAAWLDTLGHKKLITGGEYRWGCIYAQDGFGVAITGF